MRMEAAGWRIMAAVMVLAGITGCTTTAPSVQRVAADEVRDLSGRWNDTDSRLVAEEMLGDVLRRPWLSDFKMKAGRNPVVIVGTVRNLSSEHIEMGTFVKDIERELINSGTVRFVASSAERSEVRDERMDQQSFSTEESAKRLAAETGADYMLKGSIKTLIDAVSGQQLKYYQVDMELIHIENNEKVWIGSKKIKKVVKQPRARL
jgi:penicillin-binding protein activator